MPSFTVLRPDHPLTTRRSAEPVVAVVLAITVVLAALWGPFDPPATVDIDVVNHAERAVHVSVRSRSDRSVVGLGTVGPTSTARFHEVVELGEAWVFEFSAGGVDAGELELSEAQLDDRGWTVVVPDEIDRRLADAGVPPAP